MPHAEPVAYRYRWAVLFVFALLNIVLQVHWVAFAPITKEAATFYHVEPLSIAFLSMLFLLVFLVVGLPASYVLDTFGLRWGIGVGAALMGAFALLKGLYPANYIAIVIAQSGLAVAQPFIINAYTRLTSQWFPAREHATATGLAALSQYVGFIVAMGLTPPLVNAFGFNGMLQIYAVATLLAVAAFFLVFREHPPTPPSHFDEEPRLSVVEGLRHIARQPQMLLLIYLFFMGIGVFNAVSTWIEEILAPRGFSAAEAGYAGAIMMLGGIIGALIVPPLSDRLGKRALLLVGCIGLAVPSLAGFTFATTLPVLLGFSFLLGFAILSAGPVGFEYGAELAHPAPESTSQGLLLLGGQISGILFIFGMDALRGSTGTMQPFMIFFIVATAVNTVLGLRLKDVARVD